MAVFMVGASVLFGHRRADMRLVAAALVGFAGVALVLQPTIERDQWAAGLIGLVSGMLSALAYLQVGALGRAGEPSVRVVFYFSLTGTVVGLLACVIWGIERPGAAPGPLPPRAWLELLGVGGFATLAQLAMTRAYARGRALVNANLQYLGIVHAFVFGILLFDEQLSLWAVLGVALIVAAGVASTRLQQPLEAASRA
jgi:S-adenosylmethionine uptake transporter